MNVRPFLLGIDLGTSSVKALLIDVGGRVVGMGAAEYPIHHPQPDHAEQSPDEWWAATIAAVHQAVGAEDAARIAAIGISGQMHGTVLLSALDGSPELQPLHPAVIWPDQRSRVQVQEITQLVGAERLIELTGSPLATGFMAATLRWFQQERPSLWARAQTALLPKDYLRWRMTGQLTADPSDAAGSLLLDREQRVWSNELLSALHISPSLLPSIQPSASIAGLLTDAAGQALRLAPGTPVVTGAADTACALLGAGATTSDALVINLSTGGQLVLPTRRPIADRDGRIHTFCSAFEPDDHHPGWYHMGATLSAGMSLRWLRDNVFGWSGPDAYERITALAAQVEPGAAGLVFLPYLVGERTPHMDSNARGCFAGLRLQHSQAHLARAVLEGVAFACFDAYGALLDVADAPQRIILAGGGARSPLWQHIFADVFGAPVQRLLTAEQSARGAALLAGAGIGLFDLTQNAMAWAELGAPVPPVAGNAQHYRQALVRFRALYPSLKQLY
jgi:xylulokinase